MPLIDLQTNLRDLKFGRDRVAGGSSNQPYVQSDIPAPDKESNGLGYLNQDFIVRGGLKAVTNSVKDVERLGKYFLDIRNPSGLLFIAKQNLLSRTAVKTQASGLLNEGVYTPLGTLAQAGGVAFGLHTNKQGLNPFRNFRVEAGATDPTSLGEYFKAVTDTKDIDKNRLVLLAGSKITNTLPPNPLTTNISLLPTNILTYGGGPNSILGIGKTNIHFADQRTGVNNIELKNLGFFNRVASSLSIKDSNYSVFTKSEQTNINALTLLGNSAKRGLTYDENGFTENGKINSSIRQVGNFNINNSVFHDKAYAKSKEAKSNPNRSTYIPLTLYNPKIIDFEGASSKFLILNPITPSFNSDFDTSYNSTYSPTEENDTTTIPNSGDRGVIPRSRGKNGDGINALNLLGASTNGLFQFNLLPLNLTITSSNGFDANGKIDANIRQVGNLDERDLSLSGYSSPLLSNQAQNNQTLVFAQADLANLTTTIPTNLGTSYLISNTNVTTKVGDFRRNLRNKFGVTGIGSAQSFTKNATITSTAKTTGNLAAAPNYYDKNIENRVNLGSPGDRNGKNLLSYTTGAGGGAASPDSYDLINVEREGKGKKSKNDLVQFKIEVIDNDAPSSTTLIQFRAFLNNINDAFTADWKGERYVGRGENFYNYGGFDRKVSLSWTVAAQSKIELMPMYKKLSYLASVCAPDYSTTGYMRGNIVKLTIGGYFDCQPGIITGFSYDMNDANATWEIGIDDTGAGGGDVKELPHLIKVTGFNFIPIHTFTPRLGPWDSQPFIALSDGCKVILPPVVPKIVTPPVVTPKPKTPTPVVTTQQQVPIVDVSGAGGSAQKNVTNMGTFNPGNTGTAVGNGADARAQSKIAELNRTPAQKAADKKRYDEQQAAKNERKGFWSALGSALNPWD